MKISMTGLFFNSPEQKIPAGYSSLKGNITDEILATCKTVDDAVRYLEEKQIFVESFSEKFRPCVQLRDVYGDLICVAI